MHHLANRPAVLKRTAKKEQESPVLKKEDVRMILTDCGVSEDKMQDFDERFDSVFTLEVPEETSVEEGKETARSRYPEEVPIEERVFVASNLIPGRSLEVKNADFTIRINTDRTELLETRVIDGKKCLVIELEDGVMVNGIPVGR